jgi:hypothetical protein
MTAAYGHLPVLKIALFVDDDARAFWQCRLQRLEFLYPLFGNLLLVGRHFRLSRRDEVC